MRSRHEVRKVVPPKNGIVFRKQRQKHMRVKVHTYTGGISNWRWSPSRGSLLMRNKELAKAIRVAIRGRNKNDCVALERVFQNASAKFSVLAQRTNSDPNRPTFRILDLRLMTSAKGPAMRSSVSRFATTLYHVKLTPSGMLDKEDSLYRAVDGFLKYERIGKVRAFAKASDLGGAVAVLDFQKIRDMEGIHYKLVSAHFTVSPTMLLQE